jgi:CheY-like chemotaxis protein
MNVRPHVVVADDNPQVRGAICAYLEESGCEALPAGGGCEALFLCLSSPRRIAMLVSDVVMPDLTGPELARQLERALPGTPVLFVTGGGPPEIPAEHRHHWHVLMKPLNRTVFGRKAQLVLASSAGR